MRPSQVAVATCRCHLPLTAPPGAEHWWPTRDPEPPAEVRAVTFHGQHGSLLRCERTRAGWVTAGSLAYPAKTPAREWPTVGLCWAGTQHPVVQVPKHRPPVVRPAQAN